MSLKFYGNICVYPFHDFRKSFWMTCNTQDNRVKAIEKTRASVSYATKHLELRQEGEPTKGALQDREESMVVRSPQCSPVTLSWRQDQTGNSIVSETREHNFLCSGKFFSFICLWYMHLTNTENSWYFMKSQILNFQNLKN